MKENDSDEFNHVTGESRVIGPPGTGKTTYMSRQIRRAVEKFGSNAVFVTSFTKAAAAELAGRDLPIDPERITTLHAAAYRALGKPRLIETDQELIAEWNARYQSFRLDEIAINPDDPYGEKTEAQSKAYRSGFSGPEVFAQYNILRAKMVTRFPVFVESFAVKWEQFKKDTQSIDFTDMIKLAAENIAIAPGNPSIMFVDEAQDMTALQWQLLRKWAKVADHLIVAGDDDQTIFSWIGATPEPFMNSDVRSRRVLSQSYRLSASVHKVAVRWIETITNRQPKLYNPRNDESGKPVAGKVRWLPVKANQDGVSRLLADAGEKVTRGQSVMFLTTCAYMLNHLKAEMRRQGIKFHNPYRRKRGDWNPCGKGKGIDAVLSYIAASQRFDPRQYTTQGEVVRALTVAPLWSRDELLSWLGVLNTGSFLKRGMKARLDGLEQKVLNGYELDDYFLELEDLTKAVMADLGWFYNRVSKPNKERIDYYLKILRKGGVSALASDPKIIIGTIHSVKGGEADCVYLFPDLSYKGFVEYRGEGHDAAIRLFYVGMTRAREELVICQPSTEYYISGLNHL